MSTPEAKGGEPQHTFLFADLAGFTALTETHGDRHAADLVADFSGGVCAALDQLGGGNAKTIGDAVMARTDSADAAIELGRRIVGEICRAQGYPEVRVGMNTGPAIARDGDWFGASVNLAARVSAAAAGGEVLLTEATRGAAEGLDPTELEKLGARRFRNVSLPVVVYRLKQQTPASTIDPVCRMSVDPEQAPGRLKHDGRTCFFCSLECAEAFARDPARYLSAAD